MNIKNLSILILCLSIACTAIAQKSGKTKAFTSKEGKYSIHFPSKPQEAREKIPIENMGESEMVMHLCETSDGQKMYMVAFNDYPKKLIQEATQGKNTVSKLIHEAQRGVVSSQNLTIREEREISLNSYKGIFFKANNEAFYIAYEIFLVKNRLYQVGIMSKSFVSQKDINDFIDSFKLK